MEVKIDLIEDWIDHISIEIDELKKQDFLFDSFKRWKLSRIDELNNLLESADIRSREWVLSRFKKDALQDDFRQHLVRSYMNLRHKLIEPRRRRIHLSSEFKCPLLLEEGFQALKRKVENGEDLFPHLSRRIFKPNQHDGMLNDWRIQHLHLSMKSHKKRKLLKEGTKQVLYAIFDLDDAYFLCIDNHGRWADESLLNLIHSDFNHLLKPFKLSGFTPAEVNPTEKERLQLRKSGMTTYIKINNDAYMSPGLGIVMSGDSLQAMMQMDSTINFLKLANDLIIEHVGNYIKALPDDVKEPFTSIKLRRTDRNESYITALDASCGLFIRLYICENGKAFKGIQISHIEDLVN